LSDVPSEENKSTEQKAADSEAESFQKDLGPFVVAADRDRIEQERPARPSKAARAKHQ
jgi:hypothetical protein